MAQLQEQVQLLKETEGLVDTQPEKIVLEDAAAVKHKLDQTAAEVGGLPQTAPNGVPASEAVDYNSEMGLSQHIRAK
jgi:uncharacterized protein YoxC